MFTARMFDINVMEAEEAFDDLMEDFETMWNGDRQQWQDMEEQESSMEIPGQPLQSEPELPQATL